MNAVQALLSLVRGAPGAAAGLLPAVRAEGWGSDAFAPESVIAMFRGDVIDGDEASWDTVVDQNGAALIGANQIVVADLIEERVARLWRIGPGPLQPFERAITVPFDPDLRQHRGDIVGASEWGKNEPYIRRAGDALQAALAAYRLRLFPLRKIGPPERCLILFKAYLMSGEQQKRDGFVSAAVLLEGDSCQVFRDGTGEAELAARHSAPRI